MKKFINIISLIISVITAVIWCCELSSGSLFWVTPVAFVLWVIFSVIYAVTSDRAVEIMTCDNEWTGDEISDNTEYEHIMQNDISWREAYAIALMSESEGKNE